MNYIFNHYIRLKTITLEDAQFITKVANNPDLMKILCEEPTTLNYWVAAIGEWLKDKDEKDYIIVRNSDDQYLGWIGVNGLLNEDKSAWIKIISILPEFWQLGYGSKSIELIKSYLYKEGYKSLQLWTDECNLRAQKCYFQNGFVIERKETMSVGTKEILRDRILMKCSKLK